MRVRPRTRSLRVVWAPSLARRLLRHRLTQAGVVGAFGIAMVTTLSAKGAAFEQQRAEWGDLVEVVIVTEPIAVGERVIDASEIQQRPQAMMPPGAVSLVPTDSLAKVALYPGEIVLNERLSASGIDDDAQSSIAALTLPVTVQLPLLVEGDLVDLWIVDGTTLSSRRVVEHVSVLAFSDRDITVAVPNDQIEQATAASLRPVIVTRIG